VIAAFAFLTVVGRRGARPDAGTMRWFPVVGVVVGAFVGALRWGAEAWWTPLVAAAVAVVADLAVTGMLHLDGLADSADGLLPHLDRARRLAVMRAPDTGAFGVGAVVAVLGLRAAGFAAVPAGPEAIVACATIWAVSRAVMAAAALGRPYAGGGLASAFLGGPWWPPALGGLAVAAAGVALAPAAGWAAAALPVALVAGVLAAVGVVALAGRRLGGVTGDVLGAAGLLTETVALVVIGARW